MCQQIEVVGIVKVKRETSVQHFMLTQPFVLKFFV